MPLLPSCIVCARPDDLVEILVDGATQHLCPTHHAALGVDDDGVFVDRAEALQHPALDRRSGDDRRTQERRMFPRPEGRRLSRGRRATDPSV